MPDRHGGANELMALLGALRSGVHQHVRRLVEPLGLTVPQHRAVVHIAKEADRRPVSPGELSTHLGVACSTASGIIDRLERDGWVKRHRADKDRRRVHILPTDKARKLVEQEVVSVESYWGFVLDAMGPARGRRVLAALKSLRDTAEDASLDGGGEVSAPEGRSRAVRRALRALWTEEVGAAGRYFVATELAQGNPEMVAHLRQMAREKTGHAVALRKLLGRTSGADRYAERLERYARERGALLDDLLSQDDLEPEVAAFCRQVKSDEERHVAWLRKIRKAPG